MDNYDIVALTVAQDLERTLDLCQRASDYILLETGKAPDADYAREMLTQAPPVCTPGDIFAYGAQRADGSLAGTVTAIRNFYETGEWYMGLLLLDPRMRGAGLGRRMAQHIIDMARTDNGSCIRIAVLDANPRARKFWHRVGFVHERTVDSKDNADGHERHVLNMNLKD